MNVLSPHSGFKSKPSKGSSNKPEICLLLASFFHKEKCRKELPPKRRQRSQGLHGISSQNRVISTAVRTSNLTLSATAQNIIQIRGFVNTAMNMFYK
jgi:hypothetical protein